MVTRSFTATFGLRKNNRVDFGGFGGSVWFSQPTDGGSGPRARSAGAEACGFPFGADIWHHEFAHLLDQRLTVSDHDVAGVEIQMHAFIRIGDVVEPVPQMLDILRRKVVG